MKFILLLLIVHLQFYLSSRQKNLWGYLPPVITALYSLMYIGNFIYVEGSYHFSYWSYSMSFYFYAFFILILLNIPTSLLLTIHFQAMKKIKINEQPYHTLQPFLNGDKKDLLNGFLGILMISILFYISMTTKYTSAMIDYFFNFINVPSWTNYDRGIHIAAICSSAIFLLVFIIYYKRFIKKKRFSGFNALTIFVLLIGLFSSVTDIVAPYYYKEETTLNCVASSYNRQMYEVHTLDNKIVYFSSFIELENLSNKPKFFHIALTNATLSEGGHGYFHFYDEHGAEIIFTLAPMERKIIKLSTEQYRVTLDKPLPYYKGRGALDDVLLVDLDGTRVHINKYNTLGIHWSR